MVTSTGASFGKFIGAVPCAQAICDDHIIKKVNNNCFIALDLFSI
jgi:hypothetical protein